MKWRIVTDTHCGYEVQCRPWYSPFWYQHGFTNTHHSIERALQYIKVNSFKPEIVWEDGKTKEKV